MFGAREEVMTMAKKAPPKKAVKKKAAKKK